MSARRPFWWLVGAIYALVVTGTFSACLPDLEQAGAFIALDPTTGDAGTSVSVTGSGFPAEARVSVRLGPPSVGATPLSYGDAITDAAGKFTLSFTMPAQWPDGTSIEETDLVVVALNQDGSVKATAPFAFTPSQASGVIPAHSSTNTGRPVLTWHREVGSSGGDCDDVTVYWNGYVEIASCTGSRQTEQRRLGDELIDQLQTWTETYQGFEFEERARTSRGSVFTRLTFMGSGTRPVSAIEKRAIQALCEELVAMQ